jgi:hypothetical protein
MILEPIRITADWLGHATYGVNAKLTALAAILDTPEEVPQVRLIADSTRDDAVLSERDPIKLPAIYVTSDGPVTAEGEVGTVNRDAKVAVAVRVILAKGETAKAVAQTHHLLRAVVLSLRELMRNDNVASRLMNDIQILSAAELTFGRINEAVGAATATGAVTAVYDVRDNAP